MGLILYNSTIKHNIKEVKKWITCDIFAKKLG